MRKLQENSPQFLILSGTHGDEYEVIESVKKYLRLYPSQLPSYTYISEVSPSAVQLKTRDNKFGKDLNRSFLLKTPDPEVQKFMSQLQEKYFDLCLDFHEDLDTNKFYLYDSGKLHPTLLEKTRRTINSLGIELYNGIDDPANSEDPAVGFYVVDGYVAVPNKSTIHDPGTWGWLLNNKIVERMIIFEVPGRATRRTKDKIVHTILDLYLKQ